MTARFHRLAGETFQRAAARAGAKTFYFSIGGRTVKLNFAGDALVPILTPALTHLLTAPVTSPDLTVSFWESATTGEKMPAPPWGAAAFGPRGEISGYNDDRFYTIYQPGVDSLQLYDAAERQALYWVARAEQIPYWERSFPLRTIIHWWLEKEPLQPMHAAAVGVADKGVLIAGPSGSGKSTTALACLEAGLNYAGDDYVLVALEPEPYVHSLYGTAKLTLDDQYFPTLRAELPGEKKLFFLQDKYPTRLVKGFPLQAIFVPTLTGRGETTIRPASPMAALKALAPTTVFHLPRGGAAAFKKMSALVKAVPCYHLELGTEILAIPNVLRRFLEAQ